MVRRLLYFVFKTIACLVLSIALIVAIVSSVHWLRRPAPDSPEGLLAKADDLAWNNNWGPAFPLFAKAQVLFERKGDYGHALYAKVSQVPVIMESQDLGPLVAELNQDLKLPPAKDLQVRLRVLEMKARCEEEYNAGLAIQTYAQVEEMALREYKPYLASRASGERGIVAFTLGDFEEAASRVKRAYAVAKFLGDPAAHVRFASMIGMGLQQMSRSKQALVFLNEAIDTQSKNPTGLVPSFETNG